MKRDEWIPEDSGRLAMKSTYSQGPLQSDRVEVQHVVSKRIHSAIISSEARNNKYNQLKAD
jgi:hypothetical protein